MDAWEPDAFGNDSANDWLQELVESSGLQMILEAFDEVLGAGDEVVEMQAGEEAIAAAEVVAWILGHPGRSGDHVDPIEGWIEENEFEYGDSLPKKATKAIDRVFNAPSELREEWEASDDFEEWKASLASLKDRLA